MDVTASDPTWRAQSAPALVRMVLVPAVMSILDVRAWWLPGWLDRLLPRIDLESGAQEEARPSVQADRPVPASQEQFSDLGARTR